MHVYVLWHTHVLPNGDEDDKLIGIYSTESKAKEAQERAVKLPGFHDAPEGFLIDRCVLDEDDWKEGYVTV
jgi:hypothetical protein